MYEPRCQRQIMGTQQGALDGRGDGDTRLERSPTGSSATNTRRWALLVSL
ncbi:hypothetical protein [Streptomyces sp. NPDC017993]